MQEFMISLMDKFGYVGIMLLIAVENIFPPIPSEVILPLGGFMTTFTMMNVPGVIFYATVGSFIGAIILYGLGRILDKERLNKIVSGKIGKVLRLSSDDINKANDWFEKKGAMTVFFCRLIPIVRSLISIPAGMCKMKLGKFCFLTILGSAIWNTILITIGSILGESWSYISEIMGHYSKITLIIISISAVSAIIYLYRVRKSH